MGWNVVPALSLMPGKRLGSALHLWMVETSQVTAGRCDPHEPTFKGSAFPGGAKRIRNLTDSRRRQMGYDGVVGRSAVGRCPTPQPVTLAPAAKTSGLLPLFPVRTG